jgi:hypothetical protein
VEDSLCTLAYISRVTIDPGSDLKTVVSDILAAARKNNDRLSVTGALLCSGGWFAQVLEGPFNAVETIFESIQLDQRHQDVTVLYFRPLEKRAFGTWSMAFAGLSDPTTGPINIDGLLANPESVDTGKIGGDILQIMKDLIKRQEDTDAGLKLPANP